jgi:EmrB/QacA subfamily drug resistance transporter
VAGIAELRVIDGPRAGELVPVKGSLVFGRDPEADFTIEDAGGEVSRRHARVSASGDTATVEDLASTNGTFLNGERVRGTRTLKRGDRIRIGAITFEYAAPDPAPASSRAEDQLHTVSGPGAGTVVGLIDGTAVIGREPECDRQIADGEVSRRHARVRVSGGSATLEDLGSANGTYLDGERLLAPRPLRAGNQIQIGAATIEFTSPMFDKTVVRRQPVQLTAARDIVAQAPRLLTADPSSRKWWTLGVVLVTQFMLLVDVMIVTTALPSISADLKSGFSSLQWVIDAYTLALAVVLLTAGSMADIFGRKRVLTIGLIIFTVASAACSLSTDTTMLDFARAVQGTGGAVMFACGLALIVQEFPSGQRAVAFGLQGAISGIATAAGPIIGGLLVEHVGWQSVFYINLPIGVVVFFVLQRKLVNLPGPATRIDWGGLVTFSGAMFLATFATIRGNAEGWTSVLILGCFAGAITLSVAFVLIERRIRHPMLDLSLFRNPTFVGASVAAIAISFSLLGLIIYLITWMQSIQGYSPVEAGLRSLVFTGAILVCAPLAGRMSVDVTPRFTLSLGLACATASGLAFTVVDTGSRWTVLIPGMILGGAAVGLIAPTLDHAAVEVVPRWRAGMASAINSTCREGGTAAGIAVLGSLLAHQIAVKVHHALANAPATIPEHTVAEGISAGVTPQLVAQAPPDSRQALVQLAHESYAAGLRSAVLVAAVVAATACVVTIALVRKRHLHPAEDEAPVDPGTPGVQLPH